MEEFNLIPPNLTPAFVNSNAQLKRLQNDLLILTSFPDNSTLRWRPSWFLQDDFAQKYWTIHNPPNVVTEYLPHDKLRQAVMTRRMRRDDDPPPRFIKNLEHWKRYCEMYGIPEDFLCEAQIQLMRLGLPTNKNGSLDSPPSWPLYPEPQPLGQGRYLLDPTSHENLPRKFEKIDDEQTIVVHSSGALEVAKTFPFHFRSSPCAHFNGKGDFINNWWYEPVQNPKFQGKGRKWAYLPWTETMEETCRPFKIKLRKVGEDVEVRGDVGGEL
ncbi:uncharacterized protein BDR25DRAFT_309618 [Lindgomyces ingoldianus]|uniref:Uncharacterized protein n=1 Tax=Lindgomyces ingoldianus TaxID=673940 RepID=A0ACB6RCX5_9PLEO|nr:uncharacterized protein BDR25DRAFT_309618 [Lindgomyces ingoldianus]KAF2476182.1 hypothetical protein BDR25DRAFT_309618 [Lindgomyces ingoldianus]